MYTAEQVLVIGAGPGGIASAYFLQQAGISYKVIDKADVIASTWNELYPSLRLNTTRFFSHLPGRRFPLSFGLFPTGQQYHRYLAQFAADHHLNIHLGVTVYRAWPSDGGWCVETSEGTAWYPTVISATGRFCSPIRPRFAGDEDFQGRWVHACSYHGPEPFAGKRVMVIGNGPSGVDIATELGDYAQRPVLLSQRTGVKLSPRYPYGLPKHVWMMLGALLPNPLRDRLLEPILNKHFDNLETIGIKVPHGAAESSAAGATRGHELVEAVKAGKVRPVDGPARFFDCAVELTDGTHHQLDAVVLATGYRPTLFSMFDLDVETNGDGWPMRVGEMRGDVTTGQREVKGYPGLYLVGTFYQGKGALYNINVEAQQAVQEIKARLAAGDHRSKARAAG